MVDIKQMAKLARIKLNPEEESLLQEQINVIMDYIEQLSEVEPSLIEPANLEEKPYLRDDQVVSWDESHLGLDNAPERRGNLVKVPPVI